MYLEKGVWDFYYLHSFERYLVSKPGGGSLSIEMR